MLEVVSLCCRYGAVLLLGEKGRQSCCGSSTEGEGCAKVWDAEHTILCAGEILYEEPSYVQQKRAEWFPGSGTLKSSVISGRWREPENVPSLV